MSTTIKFRLTFLLSLFVLVLMGMWPAQAQAQWPPFYFKLSSLYEDGRIIYSVYFSRKVDWPMGDVVIKIPIPEGTRFLEAGGPTGVDVSFDGVEVTFFTPTLTDALDNAYFVVEVLDPTKTEYATHAWISWKGDVPGDYLTGDSTIDITRLPLKWQKSVARLRLEAAAVVDNDTITYLLYPYNRGGRRMWDLQVFFTLPPGTTYVSAEAPPPFNVGVNGQQVVFTALEFPRRMRVDPLKITVSAQGVADPLLTTSAWAVWNNVGRNAPQQEQTETSDIIVQPHTRQYVAVDAVADAPFGNYDLTNLAFQQDGPALKTSFFTAEAMGPVGEPVEFYLYLDTDCNKETGKPRGYRGAEYWVRYRHQSGKGYLYTWDPVQETWTNRRTISAFTAGGQAATVWIPGNIFESASQLCWLALSRNRTDAYHPTPPVDWLGIDRRLTQHNLPQPVIE